MSERKIVAEFHKVAGRALRLFSLTVIADKVGRDGGQYVSRTIYDVDHSRTYGYIYHESGAGGGARPVEVSGIYFASAGVAVKESPTTLVHHADRPPWRSKKTKAIRKLNRTRRLRSLPRAFDVESGDDLLDWLHCNAIDGEAVWCSECGDHLPESSLCDHVWWCGKNGEWSTPSDRCGCASQEECTA